MLKRMIQFFAFALGATSLVWNSERKRSEDRAIQLPTHPQNPSRKAGYELTDFSAKLLLSLAIAMIVLSIIMHAGLAGGLFYLKHRLSKAEPKIIESSLITQREAPPSPRLQRNPPADYAKYKTSQEQELKSYGWINRRAGIARVPIQRAMEILANEK